MKIIIIEDEIIAAKKLMGMIQTYDPSVEVLAVLPSVGESVEWLASHPSPDLILLDIHLSDGSSFEIFEKINLQSFIIFTTAFDQYLLKAFKLNSVDYLLKPIQYEDFEKAMNKFCAFYQKNVSQLPKEVIHLLSDLKSGDKKYKDRFVVRVGEKIKSIQIDQILYFFADQKVNFLKDKSGKKYIIDYSLDQLESLLDPQYFFRLNRKYLSHIQAIEEARPYFGGRLTARLQNCDDAKIIISREKTHPFKLWLGM